MSGGRRTKLPLLFGVFGHPIAHSRSPAMHQAAFEFLGLPHRYMAFDVRHSELEEALKGAKALGIGGVNLTVPLKQPALKLVDVATEAAQRIHAKDVAKIGSQQIGSVQIRPLNIGAFKIGPHQVGFLQICVLQLRLVEVGVLQVGPAKVRSPEIGLIEIGSLQVRFHQGCAFKVGPLQTGLLQFSFLSLVALGMKPSAVVG